jgi:hypothetical protein
MKAATVHQIKQELKTLEPEEILELCLRLSKFKKENKELLTYLLYECADEAAYIESIKEEIDRQFEEINTATYYYIKKSVRKVLRTIKKYVRYSDIKETEVELLLYFCTKLAEFSPSMDGSKALRGIYDRQKDAAHKAVSALHEDLQYDFEDALNALK